MSQSVGSVRDGASFESLQQSTGVLLPGGPQSALEVKDFLPRLGSARLSGQDRLFMKMPTLKIGALFQFADNVDLEEAKEHFGKALALFPRFRQKVSDRKAHLPKWKEDPHFSLENHFHEEWIGGGEEALLSRMNELKREEFNWEHPLWRVHLIHQEGGGSSMAVFVHHGIADGGRMMGALNHIFQENSESQIKRVKEESKSDHPLSKASRAVQRVAYRLFKTGQSLVKMRGAGEQSLAFVKENSSKEEFSTHCLSEPFNVADMKIIGRKVLGKRATVNDVMVAVISQGLRRYFLDMGVSEKDLKKSKVACGIPCNMRLEQRSENGTPLLGNHTGGMAITFGLGVEDPLKQVVQVRDATHLAKKTYQTTLSYQALRGISLLPRAVASQAYHKMSDHLTVIITNVPGPTRPWKMGEHFIEKVFCSLDGESRLGLGVVVMSYCGEIHPILEVDEHAFSDVELLKRHIVDAYQEMLHAPEMKED